MAGSRRQALADAAALVGESWSFRIMQEFFFGARTFGDVIKVLGAPRATTSERLKALTRAGLLAEHRTLGRRGGYRLTEFGLSIYDFALALQCFGDRHLVATPPVQLYHRDHPLDAIAICAACGQPAGASDVAVPVVDEPPVRFDRRTRRNTDRSIYTRGRATSVGLTLAQIGDRWSWLIINELAAAPSKFDHLVTALGIARNILAERLTTLTDDGLIAIGADRRYELSARGSDLIPALVALEGIGAHLHGDLARPSIHVSCGSPLVLRHRCQTCGVRVLANDVQRETDRTVAPR